MDFILGPIIGMLKKTPVILNKVELSLDVSTTFSEIIYVIKNIGKKNIKNLTLIDKKFIKDLDIPEDLFNDFEKRYFADVPVIEFGEGKTYPINFPDKFKRDKKFLIRNLSIYKTPNSMINSYCALIESSLSLLLTFASASVNSYYKYLEFVADLNNKNNIMEKQHFLDLEKLSDNAVKKEEARLTKIISIYLNNILELTNLIHKISKKIPINHNLETLKLIIGKKNHIKDLKRLVLYTYDSLSFEDLKFIKDVLDKSKIELSVEPNKFIFINKPKLNINEYILIKKPINESMTFAISLKNCKDENIIIKDHAKTIEIKYEEFSILKPWTVFINSEYKNGIKEKTITIKNLKWNKIEVTKIIQLPEIKENHSNLYDRIYR